jgi:hypothetical protein
MRLTYSDVAPATLRHKTLLLNEAVKCWLLLPAADAAAVVHTELQGMLCWPPLLMQGGSC